MPESEAELIAREFHASYNAHAEKHSWVVNEATKGDWHDIPPNNRALMVDVAQDLLQRGVIRAAAEEES